MKFLIEQENIVWVVQRLLDERTAVPEPILWCDTKEKAEAFCNEQKVDFVTFFVVGLPHAKKID